VSEHEVFTQRRTMRPGVIQMDFMQ
jgi:hypothetical protein